MSNIDISGAARSIRRLREGVARARGLEAVYQIALACLRDALGVERAAVLLFDAAGVMRFVASLGLSDVYRRRVEGHSPWPRDAANASSIWVSDVSREPTLLSLGDVFEREEIRALGFVPLCFGDKLFGKFMLYHRATHDFSSEEAELAESIAGHIAFAIEHHQIDEAYALTLPLAEDKSVSLERRVAEDVGVIDGDRHRLQQVLANLLGNALKFVPAGGKVTIGAQDLYGQIRLWISDDGPGISPEHLPKVFDRFWQANRHGTHGAGLGLAIAKSIIVAHGGEIGVHSQLGEGSTFFCWLPSSASGRAEAVGRDASRPGSAQPEPAQPKP